MTTKYQKKLSEAGVSFEVKNNGYHLIVEESIDFWPTNDRELWIIRLNKKRGYGIDDLISEIFS